MMLLHGSNKEFNEFRVGKEYSKSSVLMEGLGVYMTEKEEVANAYGRYTYNVAVNEELILDATNEETLNELLLKLGDTIGISLEDFIDVEDLVLGMKDGDYSITECGKHICDMLDSNECFYNMYQDRITYEDDCIMEKIKEAYKELLKPVIKYNDKSLGVVYIGIKEFKLLKIVNRVTNFA